MLSKASLDPPQAFKDVPMTLHVSANFECRSVTRSLSRRSTPLTFGPGAPPLPSYRRRHRPLGVQWRCGVRSLEADAVSGVRRVSEQRRRPTGRQQRLSLLCPAQAAPEQSAEQADLRAAGRSELAVRARPATGHRVGAVSGRGRLDSAAGLGARRRALVGRVLTTSPIQQGLYYRPRGPVDTSGPTIDRLGLRNSSARSSLNVL